MVLQIIAGTAWLIWLSSGTAGLKNGLMVGAFLIMGFGMKNLLDTFWKKKSPEAPKSYEAETEERRPSSFSRHMKRMSLPSPNWTVPRKEDSERTAVLRRFEKGWADPQA